MNGSTLPCNSRERQDLNETHVGRGEQGVFTGSLLHASLSSCTPRFSNSYRQCTKSKKQNHPEPNPNPRPKHHAQKQKASAVPGPIATTHQGAEAQPLGHQTPGFNGGREPKLNHASAKFYLAAHGAHPPNTSAVPGPIATAHQGAGAQPLGHQTPGVTEVGSRSSTLPL